MNGRSQIQSEEPPNFPCSPGNRGGGSPHGRAPRGERTSLGRLSPLPHPLRSALAPRGRGPRQGGMVLGNPQLEEAVRSSQQEKPLVATPLRWGAVGSDP